MDDLYRDFILDHYRHPRNHGRLEDPDLSYEEANPFCGDKIRIDVKLNQGRVEDVRFDGHGCAISQASASLLTELVRGLTVEELEKLDEEDVYDALGIDLSPTRQKCAMLPLKVLQGGLKARQALRKDDKG